MMIVYCWLTSTMNVFVSNMICILLIEYDAGMMWVALRETLFILEALRKSLLHNGTNPCQDWRFLLFSPSIRIDDVTTHAKCTR